MLADTELSKSVPSHPSETRAPNRLSDAVRLDALSQTGLMDSDAEPGFDRLTALASRLLNAPVSLVSLVDDARQFFKSQCGLPDLRETPLSHSFCQHVVSRAEPLVVTDARVHPLVRENLAIRDLNVIAYLGIPIFSAAGEPLGSFCAIDSEPRQWSEDDVEIMEDLARTVETEISLRTALEESHRAARERDMIMGEMNHRVKNLFAMVSGLIGLTARDSDSAADMSKQLRGRVKALSDAHSLIETATTPLAPAIGSADLEAIANTILAPHWRADGFAISGPKLRIDSKSAVRLSLVLHELATNAAKYGALSERDGTLDMKWTCEDEDILLTWSEHLQAEIAQPETEGFGSRLIESTIQSLGGTLDRDWTTNSLRVTISIPRDRIEATL